MRRNQNLSLVGTCLPTTRASETLLEMLKDGRLSRRQFTCIESRYKEYIETIKLLLGKGINLDFNNKKADIIPHYSIALLYRGLDAIIIEDVINGNYTDESESFILSVFAAGKRRAIKKFNDTN